VKPVEVTLARDERVTTPSGSSYPLAKGWHVVRRSDGFSASSPERGLDLEVYELEAKTAAEALEAAWQRREPGVTLVATETDSPPPREWDEAVRIDYEAPSGSKNARFALARRKGTRVWVALVDGEVAAVSRRGAQLARALSGLRAPGIEPPSYAGKTPSALEPARIATLKSFIEETRKAFEVPGVAVAVVQGGKVVFADGFGVSRLGSRDETSADTPFLIGSTTKGFATLLMAKAVDDGHFGWDTPVKKVAPNFAVGDAALTEQLTMRHLVCACSGIPRYDLELLFRGDSVTPEAMLASLAELKPTTALGETFQYNNQLVAAGGFLAARAYYPGLPLRDAWSRAIREKVLAPLGMRATTPDLSSARARGLAGSHGRDLTGELRALSTMSENVLLSTSPSGGLVSTANDMAKYLLAELSRGRSVTGAQVATEANVLLRRAPQLAVTEERAYGLGLSVGKTLGLDDVSHSGATLGQYANVIVFPGIDLGLVVLANTSSPLYELVMERLLALVFDAPDRDVLARREHELGSEKRARAKLASSLAPPEPAEVVEPLFRTYLEPRLGRVQLRRIGSELVFDAGVWSSRFGWKARADGKKDLVLLDPPMAGSTFEVREDAGKPRLHLDSQQHAYDFTRP
jgi:CubicO group peptidase (beta-lactamase class C family)